MPKLIAPDDLLPLATPLWQRLAPAWTVTVAVVPRASIGGNDGLTRANSTTSEALIRIADDLVGDARRKTLGHEFEHVNWWGVTEILDHSDPRTLALIEPRIERSGLAAVAGLARKTNPAAALAREGAPMDGKAVLEAVKTQDGAAALLILDGWLVEMIKGAMGDAGMPPEDAAPLEGEDPPAMMRRVLKSALARKAAPTDTLGPKVLARLKATTDAEAIMVLDAMLTQATADTGLARAADIRSRKDEIAATMRAGAKRFGLDDKGELLPEYIEGTLDDVKRACARIRAALPGALARTRLAPDTNDEAGLAQRAKDSGMTIEARRASEANVNRGRAAQES